MTDTNTIEQITDVNVDPNQVFDALNNEIGILSGQAVVSKLKLQVTLARINALELENLNLRKRIIAQDKDIKEMRDQLADPNHPSHRNKRKK